MRHCQPHFVFISVVLLLFTADVSAQTRLHHLAGPDDGMQVLDVILVHGLTVLPGTKARETWTVGPKGKQNWGEWLSDDIVGVRVHYLEYDASASELAGNPMTLPARSTNILSMLKAKSIGAQRPVVFIGHSLGGLVTKQLLRDASNKSRREYGEIAAMTRGVVFLATPHAGATLAGFINRYLKGVKPSAVIKDLAPHDERLKELNQWYSNNSVDMKIETQAYSETEDTYSFRIVDSTSSDPGISNVTQIPVEADHLSITHPRSREDQPYLGIKALIQSTVRNEKAFQEALEKQEPPVDQRIEIEGNTNSMEQVAAPESQENNHVSQNVTVLGDGNTTIQHIKSTASDEDVEKKNKNEFDNGFMKIKPTSVSVKGNQIFVTLWVESVTRRYKEVAYTVTDQSEVESEEGNVFLLLDASQILISRGPDNGSVLKARFSIKTAPIPKSVHLLLHIGVDAPGTPFLHTFKSNFYNVPVQE